MNKWLLMVGLSVAGFPATAADPLFVHASRLPVRAQATATSDALGHLVTNQAVRLIATRGEWCEIESERPKLHGYSPCKFFSEKPLALAEINQQIKLTSLTPRQRLDWQSRAFWVEPSLRRWIAVGDSMTEVLLSPETRAKEISGAKPLRFKTPEFEAMKQQLAQGVVAPPPTGLVTNASVWQSAHIGAALKLLPLPVAKPSYFGANGVYALNGPPFSLEGAAASAIELVDTLSGFHKIPFRMTVEQPASYAEAYPPLPQGSFIRASTPLDIIVGVWDVGSVTITFDKPAQLNGITRYAQPTGTEVKALTFDFGDHSACVGGTMDVKLHALNKVAPWENTLLVWVGKPALAGKATVQRRKWRGTGEYDKFTVDDIDLDGDRVADFSVWNGRYMPIVSAEGLWQAVFANVAGQWRLLAYDEDDDCT
ncbi:MAG: hypothetical protein IDH49_10760 [Gammaproteobacteria bacterium]|nr:hypothetical protein [Gammaproteobacteria bacterium]